MESKYLTKEQHILFKKFLKKMGVSHDSVGRILFCSAANVGYLLNHHKFKRVSFEKVYSVLRDRAERIVEAFEEIDF